MNEEQQTESTAALFTWTIYYYLNIRIQSANTEQRAKKTTYISIWTYEFNQQILNRQGTTSKGKMRRYHISQQKQALNVSTYKSNQQILSRHSQKGTNPPILSKKLEQIFTTMNEQRKIRRYHIFLQELAITSYFYESNQQIQAVTNISRHSRQGKMSKC